MRHFRATGLVIGLAGALCASFFVPLASASQPICTIQNTRNHRDFATLQAAHDAARANDTLTVKGTCVGATIVGKSLTIAGATSRKFTGEPTLVGDGITTVLAMGTGDHVTVAIKNLTITGGATSGDGGGIGIENASVTISDSTVTGNSGGLGGGIVVRYASLTLNNSTISSNTAYRGGGIFVYTGTVILNNSTVTGNAASLQGGGIELLDPVYGDGYPLGTVYLNNSSVTGNVPDNCAGPLTC